MISGMNRGYHGYHSMALIKSGRLGLNNSVEYVKLLDVSICILAFDLRIAK